MKYIGSNIRKLRKLNNLSQVEFSRRIGISQGNLSEIEQGNCKPSLDTLLSIKEQFKCSLDDLISDVNDDPNNVYYYSFLSEEEVLMLTQFKLLDKFDRKEILEIIKIKIAMRKIKNES
jgi:transcriptional regulator with XRE-family HTH domain